MKKETPTKQRPPQRQTPPGNQKEMVPQPVVQKNIATKRLENKVAIVTGSDSGIGQAVAINFAKKGAIVAFTRSLSLSLADKGVRVNGVAPGPIWTPLIASTFPTEKIETFGSDVPMKRAGEPAEVSPCYVFLASDESSYITGQVLHPNGGEIVNT